MPTSPGHQPRTVASLPALQAHYRDHGKYTYARSVLVLHNIAHQGRGPMDTLRLLEVPEQYTELFRCAGWGSWRGMYSRGG